MKNLGLAILMKDGYKAFHADAYHPDVTEVVSNFTPRSGKHSNCPDNAEVVHLGTQFFLKEVLGNMFNEQFFNLEKDYVCSEYKRVMEAYLQHPIDTSRFEKLHELGYLPIEVRSLQEGVLVPYQVPVLTIRNTHPDFAWLPNMLETILSMYLWPMMTSATTAFNYLKETKRAFKESGIPEDLLLFMCHDFSARGCFGLEAAAMSGFGHLTSFAGTDTIPAMLFAEKYYNADINKELVGGSVDATEHSVTCSWIEEGEEEFVNYLMDVASPSGILSIVSDTWDFWAFVTETLPKLKDKILQRDGKVVIRPDSGDPVKILTGYAINIIPSRGAIWESELCYYIEDEDKYFFVEDVTTEDSFHQDIKFHQLQECEVKGLVETLYDIFGGTVNDKGFKQLDPHIGAIYGDSITLERQREINNRLIAKGFAPEVVLGVGSYTYQYVTRDTHGSAMKATNVIKAGVSTPIFKDPVTDRSKKSAKGLIKVVKTPQGFVAKDMQSYEDWLADDNSLEVVYLDGEIIKETSLAEIRELVHNQA